jgi:hypothetical protein
MPGNLIHYDVNSFEKYSKQKAKRNQANTPNLALVNIGKTTRA